MGGGGAQSNVDAAVPTIDLAQFLAYTEGSAAVPTELCEAVAKTFRETGVCIVRDPRCTQGDSDEFLNMMERYFQQPDDEKLKDARKELHYQVGVTPENVEVPKCSVDPSCIAEVESMPEEHRPVMPKGPDVKWRYMCRVGPRPSAGGKFEELNAPPVVPSAFPEWSGVMDGWGSKLLAALRTTSQMLALGLGLEEAAFTQMMDLGPHLLAPTGSDLAKYSAKDTVFAGYHYDLNFITIHGKSRYPGLFVWLRDGRRVPVKVPDGCLILQAGKQLEWLTGGDVQAGMHEVIFSDATQAAVDKAREANKSLWRVSSTVFGHIASAQVLQPLGHYAQDEQKLKTYPPTHAGDQVQQELEHINLKAA
eukprot:CAMPEP_0170132688 /NCGR_PEP_ID=MMETSP0033_2-20121228/692_1 /TAXON_ID=195969 /ORGANISM="Dolichomastix tenuilepis, Strain CCMP3274" /LENGTH=363 /DNA_ID=CAMNT_0010368105 /DNA_START=36 /DNA_END=1127 /DNA_ORIENTATION=+